MRALILAAGRGSRLGALTNDRPKCLVEFAKKTLIERQISALRLGGATSIGVVRGYCGASIALSGVTYFDNTRWSDTNMVASLETAAAWLKTEPIVVSYADIFYRHELVRELVAATSPLVIAYDRQWRSLWSRRFADPLADAETFRIDSEGMLLEIGRKTNNFADIEGQYMGLLKFTPPAWQWVEQTLEALDPATRDRLDMTGLLHRLLERRLPIFTVGTEGHWGEIDNASDLELYESMVRKGELQLEG
jgi:L-glutamine-phosphate cytidylyltransferase